MLQAPLKLGSCVACTRLCKTYLCSTYTILTCMLLWPIRIQYLWVVSRSQPCVHTVSVCMLEKAKG